MELKKSPNGDQDKLLPAELRLKSNLSIIYTVSDKPNWHAIPRSDYMGAGFRDYRLQSDDEVITFIHTDGIVNALQEDPYVPGNLLFATTLSLQTTDGTRSHLIAGNSSWSSRGYVEGVGVGARFYNIKGIIHLFENLTFIVDSFNNCLRTVDRHTNRTSVYLGNCTNGGTRDGADPLFYHPSGLIRDVKKPGTLLTVCSIRDALRSINTITNTTETLRVINSLYLPTDLTQSQESGDIYITDRHSVVKYDYVEGFVTVLSGTSTEGYKDGPFSEALYAYPRGISLLANDTLLIADNRNERLRVLDLQTNSTWSIGSGVEGHRDGNFQMCQFHLPHGLYVHEDKIYIGQGSRIRVIQSATTTSVRVSYHYTQTYTMLMSTAPFWYMMTSPTSSLATSKQLSDLYTTTQATKQEATALINAEVDVSLVSVITAGVVVTVLIIVGGIVCYKIYKIRARGSNPHNTPNNIFSTEHDNPAYDDTAYEMPIPEYPPPMQVSVPPVSGAGITDEPIPVVSTPSFQVTDYEKLDHTCTEQGHDYSHPALTEESDI